jgi:N-methylhydantoinase B/oxoprolinase/acetone carboxylase alpha subunit
MSDHAVDPVELAIFRSGVHSIAEEMGAALRRTALSPNIKERRDYSCAIFDGAGTRDRDGRPHARASGINADVGCSRGCGHSLCAR